MTNGVLDFSSMPAAHVNLPAVPSSSYQRLLPSTHKASSLFSQVKTKKEGDAAVAAAAAATDADGEFLFLPLVQSK